MNYTHEFKEKREDAKPLRPVVMPPEAEVLWSIQDQYLSSRGLDINVAVANQWYPTQDRDGFARVVIPATSIENTWPYYQARLMHTDKGCPNYVPRYQSPAAPRGDALIVVHPEGSPVGVVIVEGPMDALAAAGENYIGVALMGNKPSEKVFEHLVTLLSTFQLSTTILPDRDAFSEGAVLTSKLWTRGIRCQLKAIHGAKDLAELSPSQRSSLLAN